MTTETDHIVELWRLQSAYADIVTRRAWNELDEVFLPDTSVHLDTVTSPTRKLVGPAAFGEFVADALERFDHFTFVILNTVVEVDPAPDASSDPDHAWGRIFMCELRHETATDRFQEAHGVYQDDYRRVDGRWWFAERRYRSIARTGPPTVIFGVPPDLRPLDRRPA